jgi:Ubiquitin carboxyl-terminal hydrolase
VLLAILIHFILRFIRSNDTIWRVLKALAKLDIHNTVPRLQHDFCTLWNEIVQEAWNQGYDSTPVDVLRWIRHPYTALHHGTDAAPTAFHASTYEFDDILYQPSSYPFCTLASHRPDSAPHVPVPLLTPHSPEASSYPPTDGGNTASRQAEQVKNAIEPPSSSNPTTTGEIGATTHGPDITPSTNLVHSSSHASPTALAPQNITLSPPLEASEQQDLEIVVPSAEPGTSHILSASPTHAPPPTLAPIPASLPNIQSQSHDPGLAAISNSSHFAPPSIGSSIPASRPTGDATLPRLRARGLVNTRNTCFANPVLQLLVNSPPFWNLFKELGNLKGQRGAGVPQTDGGVTPLVDATVRFFKEFIAEEEPPSTQQQLQSAASRTSRVDEEKKDDKIVDSFEPTYLYDAMKEKRQLKPLLVRSHTHVAASCY